MTLHPIGVVVFAGLCALLGLALTNPAWTHVAEAVATVLILAGLTGAALPATSGRR